MAISYGVPPQLTATHYGNKLWGTPTTNSFPCTMEDSYRVTVSYGIPHRAKKYPRANTYSKEYPTAQ